eukprot:NODE_303_length_10328_cov_1.228077.p3 type:complete len:428 gc:universal NODE_303_length_10328_cov_1.228077:5534-6817(+)
MKVIESKKAFLYIQFSAQRLPSIVYQHSNVCTMNIEKSLEYPTMKNISQTSDYQQYLGTGEMFFNIKSNLDKTLCDFVLLSKEFVNTVIICGDLSKCTRTLEMLAGITVLWVSKEGIANDLYKPISDLINNMHKKQTQESIQYYSVKGWMESCVYVHKINYLLVLLAFQVLRFKFIVEGEDHVQFEVLQYDDEGRQRFYKMYQESLMERLHASKPKENKENIAAPVEVAGKTEELRYDQMFFDVLDEYNMWFVKLPVHKSNEGFHSELLINNEINVAVTNANKDECDKCLFIEAYKILKAKPLKRLSAEESLQNAVEIYKLGEYTFSTSRQIVNLIPKFKSSLCLFADDDKEFEFQSNELSSTEQRSKELLCKKIIKYLQRNEFKMNSEFINLDNEFIQDQTKKKNNQKKFICFLNGNNNLLRILRC